MATWTKATQSLATWTKATQSLATWTKAVKTLTTSGFILLEQGGYMLQEDGASKLTLEQSSMVSTPWNNVNKS